MPARTHMAACLLAACFGPVSANGQTELWGENGAAWQPGSPLPEFSFVGYHRGDKAIPNPEPEIAVTDFGAVGDGETDCTAAFQRALSEAGGKAIRIPEGTWVISDRLRLSEAGTVLVGEGTEKTILLFTKGLQEIEPTSATTGGGMQTTQWSWSGGLITLGNSSKAAGSGGTPITSEAQRGQSSFEVEDPSLFEPGTHCVVEITDSPERTLLDYAHRGRPGDLSLMLRSRFSLSQPLTVSKVEGNRVTVEQRLRFDLRGSWSPVLTPMNNRAQELGIADFTIRFPEEPYRGHWLEDGMNGFEIRGVNNWARDIRIQNSDSGAFTTGT